jgi:hypothetical protein
MQRAERNAYRERTRFFTVVSTVCGILAAKPLNSMQHDANTESSIRSIGNPVQSGEAMRNSLGLN